MKADVYFEEEVPTHQATAKSHYGLDVGRQNAGRLRERSHATAFKVPYMLTVWPHGEQRTRARMRKLGDPIHRRCR